MKICFPYELSLALTWLLGHSAVKYSCCHAILICDNVVVALSAGVRHIRHAHHEFFWNQLWLFFLWVDPKAKLELNLSANLAWAAINYNNVVVVLTSLVCTCFVVLVCSEAYLTCLIWVSSILGSMVFKSKTGWDYLIRFSGLKIQKNQYYYRNDLLVFQIS